MVARSFFSTEILFSFTRSAALHGRFRDLVQTAPGALFPEQKWRLHRRAANLMLEGLAEAERGCWEYMDDDGSDEMWNEWESPLHDPSRRPGGREPGGFFTFTMMFQTKSGTLSDRSLASACRLGEGQLWSRGTFATMLQTLPALGFDSVVKDALYLMPRDATAGFTERELAADRMKYLRVLG
jgi:hypothetical protein